jgi:uncharacterized protein (TIGR00730 family)
MFCRRIREYAHFLDSLIKTNFRLLWGMWRLTRLPHPAITVFGGSRIPHDSIHAKMATQLAKMLAADGFSIITGGGPGIMEAANQGAFEYLNECRLTNGVAHCPPGIISAGVSLFRLNKENKNPYVQEFVEMRHFFARKWLLVRYSTGFVVFPGGFGTLDELFEVVTLVQCSRMAKVPIVLMDKSYWSPLVEWIERRAVPYQLIEPEDTKIIQITDSVEEAFAIIHEGCKHTVRSPVYNGVDKP